MARINSRRKGIRGETELFKLLSDYLGIICKRNVDQARDGGADSIDIPGWAMEVKRHETLADIKAWWGQACRQASVQGRKPLLWFRASRQPWRAVIDLHDLRPDLYPVEYRHTAIISFDDAGQLIRESLNREPYCPPVENPYGVNGAGTLVVEIMRDAGLCKAQ